MSRIEPKVKHPVIDRLRNFRSRPACKTNKNSHSRAKVINKAKQEKFSRQSAQTDIQGIQDCASSYRSVLNATLCMFLLF